jgi:hypothetical protein
MSASFIRLSPATHYQACSFLQANLFFDWGTMIFRT